MDQMRASDREREDIVAILRAAAQEGRLDVDELDERTARAYAAKTRGELAEIVEDLPHLRPAPPPAPIPPRHVPRPSLPGYAYFSTRWSAPASPDRVAHDLLRYVAPTLHYHRYRLAERTPLRLVFTRKHQPAWTIVVAILLFPIGLLALLATKKDYITIDLAPHGDRTLMLAQGVGPLPVRQAFAILEE